MQRSTLRWAALLSAVIFAHHAPSRAADTATPPAAPRPATAPADRTVAAFPPEEILNVKGLTKLGATFVTEFDAKLPERLRALRAAQRAIDENARKRAALDADIQRQETEMARVNAAFRDLNKKLLNTKDASQKNKLGAQVNILITQMRDGERAVDAQRKALAKLVDPRDDYVGIVLDLSMKMEAAAKHYDAIAADADVTDALARLNAPGTARYKLGPSSAFASELPFIRRQRQLVDGAAIKLERLGGIYWVNVTLNGTVTQKMAVDTGATNVCMPAALAQKLGWKPGPTDRLSKSLIANGKSIDVRVTKLKSVRVGQFTVEDVDCEIGQEKDSPCLLGGAFLRHFVFRFDLTAGELHLAQLDPKAAAALPPDGGAPAAPGNPDAKPPAPAPEPVRTKSAGGNGGGKFEDLAPQNGFLVGFNCTVGSWAGHRVINSVQPVFQTGLYQAPGERQGRATGDAVSAIARPGYAVGGIMTKSGDRLDGFKVVFMRRKGEQFDPIDTYESPWIGGKGGSDKTLGCDGKRVIGIFGRGGVQIDALGLIQSD